MACLATPGSAAGSDDGDSAGKVKLERLNWKQFQARLRREPEDQVHPGRRLVDDVRSMQGELPARARDAQEIRGARAFRSSRFPSTIPTTMPPSKRPRSFSSPRSRRIINILLDEGSGGGFEKLNINAIPAVFVYGPDGKEVKRFTMDDTKNQFTYDEVEKAISALLDAKS